MNDVEVKFSINRCLAYDRGDEDARCLRVLEKHLMAKAPSLALYGAGKLGRYLLEMMPDLGPRIESVIDDDPSKQNRALDGVTVTALSALPASVKAVFLCSTRWASLEAMRKRLQAARPDVEVITLHVLRSLDILAIPDRAWRRSPRSIYPIEIPEVQFDPGQDMILLELPPRYMPMIPNGIGYLHNVLKQSGIGIQTADLSIPLYHRYHSERILDDLDQVVAPGGYVMKDDPWDNTNTEEWTKPEVIEYFRPYIDEVVHALAQARPKILGLSLNGINRFVAQEVVRGVRAALPEILVLVGGYNCVYPKVGPHLFSDYDYMAINEADLTVGPLVKALLAGERPKDQPGIISRFDSPDRVWTPAPLLQDLDAVDFPHYEWIDTTLYRTYDGNHLIPITASRGCHWGHCSFCCECFTWRKRSPEKVVDEIEWWTQRGARVFHFNESDVNGDPDALADICRGVLDRQLETILIGQLRIDPRSTPEYFRLLRAAGFTALRFGVDGWSQHTLKLQKKGYTMSTVFQNLRDCYEAGISVSVNLVIGVPGETDEDVRESIQNILAVRDYVDKLENINTLILGHGSQYFNDPEKHSIRFRGSKEEIYQKHPVSIPTDLWYSVDPYIDQDVRVQRLHTICTALYQGGVNIGPFAESVVARLLREGSAQQAEALSEMPPQLVQEGYLGFNLVVFRGKIHCVAQAIGPIDIARVSPSQLQQYKRNLLWVVASSLPEARTQVLQIARQRVAAAQRRAQLIGLAG